MKKLKPHKIKFDMRNGGSACGCTKGHKQKKVSSVTYSRIVSDQIKYFKEDKQKKIFTFPRRLYKQDFGSLVSQRLLNTTGNP